MPNDFQPVVGHRFQFRVERARGWSGVVDCVVLIVDAPRRLSYSWRNERGRLDTVVTWSLEPCAGGTRLVLAHAGFRGLRSLAISHLMGRGWKSNILGSRLPAAARSPAARADLGPTVPID